MLYSFFPLKAIMPQMAQATSLCKLKAEHEHSYQWPLLCLVLALLIEGPGPVWFSWLQLKSEVLLCQLHHICGPMLRMMVLNYTLLF